MKKQDIIDKYAGKYAGLSCTLDGKTAKILGRLNKFATIAESLDGPAYEWSWQAVERIMTEGGRFKT